jgi:hypothetical protein
MSDRPAFQLVRLLMRTATKPSKAFSGRRAARSRRTMLTALDRAMPPGEPSLCLVTRIVFPRRWHVVRAAIAFRQMKRRGRTVPGFLDAALVIRRMRVVVIVSWWTDDLAIADFSTAVPEHLAMARWAFRQGALTWSGLYELRGLSTMTRSRLLTSDSSVVTT